MNRALRWGLVATFVLLLLLLTLAYPARVAPSGGRSSQYYQQGPYTVISNPFYVVDSKRGTMANGSFEGSAQRELKGTLWYPDWAEQPGLAQLSPLVIYSHGFMSFHQEGAYITEFLASHGYVAVAVDFPLTNYFAPGQPNLSDVARQPGDVSFVMDEILRRNRNKGDVLYGRIDEQRIAVMGLSLGGMTTELVTFDPRFKDDRIKAAISIAGPSRMMTEKFFSFVQVPFMMIAGDQDAIVPYELNALPVRQHDPDSLLVTIKGGSHAGFAGISSVLFRWVNNPDRFGCASILKAVKAESTPFAELVSEPYGVTDGERRSLCQNADRLPRALRPAQQQMLTALASYSFLESLFHPDPGQRKAFADFLLQGFAAENPEITVDAGDYRAAYKQ